MQSRCLSGLLLLLSLCSSYFETSVNSPECGIGILYHQAFLYDSVYVYPCSVIGDEEQARRCLNLTNQIGSDSPFPVVLDSSVKNGSFVCGNSKPLYTFSCSIYGTDTIWYFNNVTLTAFLPGDTAGITFKRLYPELAPVYSITVTLTQKVSVGRYGIPFAVSTLTVQPYNQSQIKVIPFTVSCQTHCGDVNRTEVCQRSNIIVAGNLSIMHGMCYSSS